MKKLLSILLVAALTVMAFSVTASAKAPKNTGSEFVNLATNGDFEVSNIDQYFWMNAADGAYRGGTCSWQATGGKNNSGCIKMYGTANTDVAALCVRNQVTQPMFVHIDAYTAYYVAVDVFRPVGNDATIQFNSEGSGIFTTVSATKNGEWETLSGIVWNSSATDLYMRLLNETGDMGADEYILIDNFMVCKYDINANYRNDYNFVPGNLAWDGDFEVSLNPQYSFWMEAGDGAYRGGTCSVVDGLEATGRAGKCIKMVGTPDTAVASLGVRNLTYGNCTGGTQFMRVEAGKQYVLSVDVFRPVGVTATVQVDAENGMGITAMTATKNGEWERISQVFTATGTGDCYVRVLNEGGNLGADECVYIDNYYLGEYNAQYDYTWSPETGDSMAAYVAISAVVCGAAVVLCKKSKRG